MLNEITRITLFVTQTLEQLDIAYAVGGSLASSLHGIMRATLDVDIVADMRLEHIRPLVTALSQEFYADGEMMRDAIERHSSFNLIHYETAYKVDIFIPKLRPYGECCRIQGRGWKPLSSGFFCWRLSRGVSGVAANANRPSAV